MNLLGNGLSDAKHHEAALSVRETDLATRRRLVELSDTRASATQCALACKIVALLVALVAAVG